MDDVERQLLEHAGDGMTPPDDPELESKCPSLWWFLTVVKWSDGTVRMPSTIQIDRVAGAYKVTLQDHALGVQKRVICSPWSEVLLALERAVSDVRLPWEPYKSYRVKTPKVPEKPIPAPSQNGRKRVK